MYRKKGETKVVEKKKFCNSYLSIFNAILWIVGRRKRSTHISNHTTRHSAKNTTFVKKTKTGKLMNITGQITGIKYKPLFLESLCEFDIRDFNINKAPATCLLRSTNSLFAVSKWVSPKRTRSYPFERVYNSLTTAKKLQLYR